MDTKSRKIIHIDMDAFYASVEQRDNPTLRGLPVVVGGAARGRGVVAACSYEARVFGIRSAMPSHQAYKLCREAIFLRPRFPVYQEASRQIRAIFDEYTPLVEPLSLDEAYLDVTNSEHCDGSASAMAKAIKQEIVQQTGLVASAGVSYNKFLAKIASDFDKPNGFCRILPHEGEAFVGKLPIGKFYGVGAVTEARMHDFGIKTGADLRSWTLLELQEHFGKSAQYYFNASRGIDHRSVEVSRERKSLGSEKTFSTNLHERSEMLTTLQIICEGVCLSLRKRELLTKNITIKVRFSDFQIITRSLTLNQATDDPEYLNHTLSVLLDRALPENDGVISERGVRLLGVSAAALQPESLKIPRQLSLFNE